MITNRNRFGNRSLRRGRGGFFILLISPYLYKFPFFAQKSSSFLGTLKMRIPVDKSVDKPVDKLPPKRAEGGWKRGLDTGIFSNFTQPRVLEVARTQLLTPAWRSWIFGAGQARPLGHDSSDTLNFPLFSRA